MREQDIVELFKKHKETEFYKKRVKQIEAFVPLARDIIIETLNKSHLKTDDFNGFIQMFKADCTKDTFLKYLRQNIVNQTKLLEFEDRFEKINVGGLTGTGLGSIQTELDVKSVEKLKAILLRSISIKSKDEAMKIHKELSELNLPYIREAVYTPWLYYLNPTIFPIQNSSIKSFLKAIECKYDYADIIEKFYDLKELLSLNDFGYIDSLAHEFSINNKFYLVGAYWEDAEPKDQTDRFIKDNIWENGYSDKFHKEVNKIPVNSRIAIKSVYTKGKTKSVMLIKARGIVKKNYNNGRMLDVEWEDNFHPFEVNFSVGYWTTVKEVKNQEHIKTIWPENPENKDINDNVFLGKKQYPLNQI
ncbi:MAG: hypothetical protein ACOCQ4_03095, partial [bacterium]